MTRLKWHNASFRAVDPGRIISVPDSAKPAKKPKRSAKEIARAKVATAAKRARTAGVVQENKRRIKAYVAWLDSALVLEARSKLANRAYPQPRAAMPGGPQKVTKVEGRPSAAKSKVRRGVGTPAKAKRLKKPSPDTGVKPHFSMSEAQAAGLTRLQWQDQANKLVAKIERGMIAKKAKPDTKKRELFLAEKARQAAFSG